MLKQYPSGMHPAAEDEKLTPGSMRHVALALERCGERERGILQDVLSPETTLYIILVL